MQRKDIYILQQLACCVEVDSCSSTNRAQSPSRLKTLNSSQHRNNPSNLLDVRIACRPVRVPESTHTVNSNQFSADMASQGADVRVGHGEYNIRFRHVCDLIAGKPHKEIKGPLLEDILTVAPLRIVFDSIEHLHGRGSVTMPELITRFSEIVYDYARRTSVGDRVAGLRWALRCVFRKSFKLGLYVRHLDPGAMTCVSLMELENLARPSTPEQLEADCDLGSPSKTRGEHLALLERDQAILRGDAMLNNDGTWKP